MELGGDTHIISKPILESVPILGPHIFNPNPRMTLGHLYFEDPININKLIVYSILMKVMIESCATYTTYCSYSDSRPQLESTY